MNYEKENINRLISYFKEGCKEKSKPLTMGLELEHFIVDKASRESVSYSGEKGVEAVLEKLKPFYSETAYANGHLIGLWRENLSITIEPAAQIEVSISPQTDWRRIQVIYDQFLAEIRPVLLAWGYDLVTFGYQPKSRVDELELIPKDRYRFMKEYFDQIGPYGKYMMKGTAATQVSIDYYSEEDFMAKYKIAYAIYPILAMLCDNVPWMEGRDTVEPLTRMKIWDNVDNARVKVEKFLQEGTIDFKNYAEFVYHAPLIVDKKEDGDYKTNASSSEIFSDRLMTKDDMEHALSMVFPMIRLKWYLEIRVADSMPIGSVFAYLLLIKGLFTDITKVKSYIDELVLQQSDFTEKLLTAIRTAGIDGQVDEITVKDMVLNLYGMAISNLGDSEVAYLEDYKKGILQKGSLLL